MVTKDTNGIGETASNNKNALPCHQNAYCVYNPFVASF